MSETNPAGAESISRDPSSGLGGSNGVQWNDETAPALLGDLIGLVKGIGGESVPSQKEESSTPKPSADGPSPPSATPGAAPTQPTPAFQSQAAYESDFSEYVIRRTSPRPSAGAVAAVRKLRSSSPLVVVVSRFGAEHIASHAVVDEPAIEQRVWCAPRNGATSLGEIENITRDLSADHAARPRVRWIEADIGREDPADLLHKLMDPAVVASLREQLVRCSAQLVVALRYNVQEPLKSLCPDCERARGDWLFEAEWREELLDTWRQTSKVRAAERSGSLLEGFASRLRDVSAQIADAALWSAMIEFHHVSIEGDARADDLAEHFDKALESARSQEPHANWLASIRALLRTPPEEMKLQKTLIAVAALLDKDTLTYQNLREFGPVVLHRVPMAENQVESVREKKRGNESVVIRQMRPGVASASAAWTVQLDHLLREVGLLIRTERDVRVVEFPDALRRDRAFAVLRDEYPSVLLDLLDRLLDQNALFHTQHNVRACARQCLKALQVLDPSRFRDLREQVLAAADRLTRYGPQSEGDVNHDVPHGIFKARLHSLCVREIYEAFAPEEASAAVQEELVPQDLWRRKADIERILLRTQVCMDLPGFRGMGALGRCIDRADPALFQPLRGMISDLSGIVFRNQLTRLGSVSGWLTAETEDAALSRSRVLAQQVWIDILASDTEVLPREYDPDHRPNTLSRLFIEAHPDVQSLWPALMRLDWSQANIAWAGQDQWVRQMCTHLLMSRVDSASSRVVMKHREILIQRTASVLFRILGRRRPDVIIEPGDDEAAKALEAMELIVKKALEVSEGDPKTLEVCLRLALSGRERDEIAMARLVRQVSALYEYLASPLSLFCGLLLAQWCFHRTGIGIDENAAFRDDEDFAAQRRVLARFLDSLVAGLANQPEPYRANAILTQWRTLIRVLQLLASSVRKARELDAHARDDLARMLNQKEGKLSWLANSLEKRLVSSKGASA